MAITAQMVRELREKTGAGILDCKKALNETEGDFEKAVEVLRTKGLAAAAKKSGRTATEGLVHSYIHGGGRIGVLLEVNCETDFVARTDDFKTLVHDLALQIAATNPIAVARDDVDESVLDGERRVYKAQAMESGKPEAIAEKMVVGRMEKFLKENVLLEQVWVKDPDKTIEQLLTEAISTIGENIKIRRFERYELGEGLERKNEDFAAEVAAAAGLA
jgi:elongation factor Ts